MQQEKFKAALQCIENTTEKQQYTSTPKPIIASPAVRKGSVEYWKQKYLALNAAVEDLSSISSEISLDEIPGFLPVNKIKPKPKEKTVRVTQVYESFLFIITLRGPVTPL